MYVGSSAQSQKVVTMRSYPRNSPEAAARIVALVLISDGNISSVELEAMNQPDGVAELGLAPEDLPNIVKTLCEDLLMDGFDGRLILSHLGDATLASLLAEVDDRQLQAKVLHLAVVAANADKHLADGEASFLDAISRHWGLPSVTETE
jgi:tellurite resistance protein